jgi:hypothetical protein
MLNQEFAGAETPRETLPELIARAGNKITAENSHLFKAAYINSTDTEKALFPFGWLFSEPSPEKRPTYIYMVKSASTGLVKIGRSINPTQRIAAIRTQSGQDLTVVCVEESAPDLEQVLHRKFTKHRVCGEWFDLTADQIDEALSVVSQFQLRSKA